MLFICSVLIPSAVVHGIVGLDERGAFAIFASLVLGLIFLDKTLDFQVAVPALVLLVALGAAASVISNSNTQLLMGVTLAIAIICGRRLFELLRKPLALEIMSWFSLILLVGGFLGMLYFYVGGAPLYQVVVGYRTTYLYLSTFSFAEVGAFIRPSGIFDEPGALIMFVGIVTMFNDVLRRNFKLNLAILFMVLFTGSLAGFFLVVLYVLLSNGFAVYRRTFFIWTPLVGVVCILFHVAFPSNPLSEALETFYGERLQVEDGRLVGDNRSNQIEEFFEIVDEEILLRGANVSDRVYERYDLSSNPFSIVFGYGLLISVPYFLLLAWLVFVTIRGNFKNSYTTLGLLFLLLQRPYLFNMSWSIILTASIFLAYYASRSRNYRASWST